MPPLAGGGGGGGGEGDSQSLLLQTLICDLRCARGYEGEHVMLKVP